MDSYFSMINNLDTVLLSNIRDTFSLDSKFGFMEYTDVWLNIYMSEIVSKYLVFDSGVNMQD